MKKVAIILLNWNGKKDTFECLHSLSKLTDQDHEIFVVDNGSQDDSVVEIRKNFPWVTLIENFENLGFAEGNNRGIKRALKEGFEFVFLLNNDTIVDPSIVSALLQASREKPEGGVFGSQIYRYDRPEEIDHFGGMWNDQRGEFDSILLLGRDREKMQQVDYVHGCAFFIRKEVLQTIGLLEKNFFLIWEETDFCSRARKKGFEIWSVPEAKVWHKISSSFIGGKPHTHYFWWRNRLLWVQRNLSFGERVSLTFRVLIPEILQMHKLWFLKSLQIRCLRLFSLKISQKKIDKQKLYRAGCLGFWDYVRRHFGNAPPCVFKKE